MYGWRARIGFICPSVTAETFLHEFHLVAPPGVALVVINLGIRHLGRDEIGGSLGMLKTVAAELDRTKVDIIVLGGSPPVTYGGFGFDKEIIRQIGEVTSIPATTSQTCAVDALRRLEVQNVVIGSPFAEDQNLLLKTFLEDSGFKIAGAKGLALPVSDIARMPLSASYRLAKETFLLAPDAEGVYLPCALMPTFANIAPLERDLGVPVVTSFQAMLWGVFTTLRIHEPIRGYGRLLESLAP